MFNKNASKLLSWTSIRVYSIWNNKQDGHTLFSRNVLYFLMQHKIFKIDLTIDNLFILTQNF